MPIQKVPLETLQKVRQYIKSVTILPEAENRPRSPVAVGDDEPPEPNFLGDLGNLFNFGAPPELESLAPNLEGKWFVSSINPGAAFMKLPGLRLKPDLRLITYLYRTGKDGKGITWAVPEPLSTTAQLEKVLVDREDTTQFPQPEGALANVMDAVNGDRSPLSFTIASILQRELKELGALGIWSEWTHHRLIDALPPQVKWQWLTTPPKDLSPKVLIYPDNRAAIEFFSCRVTPPIAIFQHIDQYTADHYQPTVINRAIATPPKNKPA